jgi:hypothetical protein
VPPRTGVVERVRLVRVKLIDATLAKQFDQHSRQGPLWPSVRAGPGWEMLDMDQLAEVVGGGCNGFQQSGNVHVGTSQEPGVIYTGVY